MPHKSSRILVLFILCFYYSSLFAQTPTSSNSKEAITNSFERYFELERENIHVQLAKNVYLTNESIWFKGYVYNKKLNLPFYETTNVYVQLIDESGAIITNQLLYSMSGFFSGKIKLDNTLKSGYYYLQFYTNWMNNFEEDESFVQRIKIKNSTDTDFPLLESINPAKISVAFYPEGGNYITNVSNSVGVKITDINGKAIPNVELEIQDQNNVVQKSIPINAFGMGKFEFIPNSQIYKAVLNFKGQKLYYDLPISMLNGITLELNNYVFDNKTLVKIKYNKAYENALKSKALYLVIQKNEKSNIIDLKLDTDNNETTFFFSNELLFKGVNTIRIIDAELNEIAQRMLFLSENRDSKITINQALKTDKKVSLSGHSNWNDACVSVAIIPTNTKLISDENNITSLMLNSYLNNKLLIKREYFNDINRTKKYELDLMLLTQKDNKYNWNTIKQKTIKPLYTFEKGLDIKGSINSSNADLKNSRVELKNLMSDVLAATEGVEGTSFSFKNTTVNDSIPVICDLMGKKDGISKEMNYYLTVINKYKKFNKNFLPVPYVFPEKNEGTSFDNIETPSFEGDFILLDEVEVKKEKLKLKRQNQPGNSYLRGYKVGVDVSENTDVLTFIEQNGFNVTRMPGSISITGRARNSLYSAQTTPIVYIDGRQIMSFEELFGMRMPELEEIYISSTAIVPSINNNLGIIKLYRKEPSLISANSKNKPKIIIGGFKMITPFENADYVSENTTGFENFGLIHWIPWILTDDKGNLKASMPNKKHKSVKLIIEGLTLDGQIISEVREVNLSE